MGLIAKSMTKRKVAPESGPDNVVAGSPMERALLRARRVRAAALTQDLAAVASQTRRGNVSILALGTASQLWYRREGDARWTVTLGAVSGGGRQADDWVLQASVPSLDDNTRVEVSTPAYLTVDGALANARVYETVRGNLLDAFAYEDRGDDAERQLGEASIAAQPIRGVRPSVPPAGDVLVRLAAAPDATISALVQVGLPLQRTGSEFVWRTGLGDTFLNLTQRDGSAGLLEFAGQLHSADGLDPYRQAALTAAAVAWRGRTLMFLKKLDDQVQLHWPESA